MLTIGIVGHTSRRSHATQLAAQVDADFLSIDNGSLGCDDNHEAVQHHLANLPSTWSVILEDDAQPVPQLRTQLRAALPMSPTPIVSLYLGRKRPPHWQTRIRKAIRNANTSNTNWLISTHLLHAVGYAIKTDLLPSLLSHTSTLPVDQHIGHWARYHGHTIAYTNPSLIDHADLPTIVEHPDGEPRKAGRTAWNVGTRHHWNSTTMAIR